MPSILRRFRAMLPAALLRGSLAVIAAALALGALSSQGLRQHARAAPLPELAIDATPGGAPCSAIDAAGARKTPSTSSVDICLKNPLGHSPFSLGLVDLRVVYDDTVIVVTNVILDQTVVTGSFSCINAAGDEDPLTGPGHGLAHLFCLTFVGDGPTIATGSTVRIATLNIQAVGAVGRSTSLALRDVLLADNDGPEIGSCNPPLYQQMTCTDGSIALPATSLGGVAEYPTLASGGSVRLIAAVAAAAAAMIAAACLGGLAWRRRTLR